MVSVAKGLRSVKRRYTKTAAGVKAFSKKHPLLTHLGKLAAEEGATYLSGGTVDALKDANTVRKGYAKGGVKGALKAGGKVGLKGVINDATGGQLGEAERVFKEAKKIPIGHTNLGKIGGGLLKSRQKTQQQRTLKRAMAKTLRQGQGSLTQG